MTITERLLGKGAYGSVWTHPTDPKLARKRFTRREDESVPYGYLREIVVNRMISSPYVVKFTDFGMDHKGYYVDMPLALYSLCTKQRSEDPIPSDKVKYYARQMAQGLLDMHNATVIHQDIHSGNFIYFEAEDTFKLCDFGASSFLTESLINTTLYPPMYRAPELWKRGRHTNKTDVWALGCTFYLLATQTTLITRRSEQTPWYTIINSFADSGMEAEYIRVRDPQLRDLLVHMLKVNPDHRYSMQQVLQHEYFASAKVCESTRTEKLRALEVPLVPLTEHQKQWLDSVMPSVQQCLREAHCWNNSYYGDKDSLPQVDEPLTDVMSFKTCCMAFTITSQYAQSLKPSFIPDILVGEYAQAIVAIALSLFRGDYPDSLYPPDWDSVLHVLKHSGNSYVTVGDYYLCNEDPRVDAVRSLHAESIYTIMQNVDMLTVSKEELAHGVHRQ